MPTYIPKKTGQNGPFLVLLFVYRLPIGRRGCENYIIGNFFFKTKSKNLSGAKNLAQNGLKLPSKHFIISFLNPEVCHVPLL
jgi:hypothetical protein